MSSNQDIATNAQAGTDAQAAGDDVEGHFRVLRSDMSSGDEAARGQPGQPEGFRVARSDMPEGFRVARSDMPDGEDDVEGHLRSL